jgi:hypothetical protein
MIYDATKPFSVTPYFDAIRTQKSTTKALKTQEMDYTAENSTIFLLFLAFSLT